MKKLNVLFITTSHDTLGDTGEKTGVWLEELAGPYYTFKDAGASVTIASPKGGAVPLDPKSQEEDWLTDHTRRFYDDKTATETIKNTLKVSEVKPEEYDVLFFPGGHGPMWDMGDNPEIAKIVKAFDGKQKPIGLVCHGVAALKGVKNEDGTMFVKGKQVTSFTNSEEEAVQLTDVVPFLLETELINEGGVYTKAEDWNEYVVLDGNLVTGQNPQSSVKAAEKLLEMTSLN